MTAVKKTAGRPRKAATKKPGTAITKRKATPSVIVTGIPTSQQVAEAIASGEKLYVDVDDTERGASILPGIIEHAEKAEDLFGTAELAAVKNHLDETLRVLGIASVNNSDFAEGLGIYIVITVVDTNGEVFNLGVGAADPMAKLLKLNELGAFPYDVAFVQAEKATRAGFRPINLETRQLDRF